MGRLIQGITMSEAFIYIVLIYRLKSLTIIGIYFTATLLYYYSLERVFSVVQDFYR